MPLILILYFLGGLPHTHPVFTTWLPSLSLACFCLPGTNNINISLPVWYNSNVCKKKREFQHPGRLKYLCHCEVNGSKSESENRRRIQEEIACKAVLSRAGLHNQWSEVCIVPPALRLLHASPSYFYREDRSVAMLFEKVSCSKEKRAFATITPRSGNRRRIRGSVLAGGFCW